MNAIGNLSLPGRTSRPSKRISPASGLYTPARNLDERRLAGAILSKQRVDLAPTDVKVDVIESKRRREALGDTAHLQQCAIVGGFAASVDLGRHAINPPCTGPRSRSGGPPGIAAPRPARMPAGTAATLVHAPDLEVVLLVVVAGDERVLVATFGLDVVLGDQERRLNETARLIAVEGAVQFVDGLPGLEFDRLGHSYCLVLIALADAVIRRAVAVGADELDLIRGHAAGAQNRNGKVPVVIANGRPIEWQAEALDPARGQLRLALRRFGGRRVHVFQNLAAASTSRSRPWSPSI